MDRRLPDWSEGRPEKTGLYVAFSTHPCRTDGPDLYVWDGEFWKHHVGWYDHVVTHWMLIKEMPV